MSLRFLTRYLPPPVSSVLKTPPTILAPYDADILFVGKACTIAGTCANGAVVSVFANGILIGTATVVGSNWTITWTPSSAGVVTLSVSQVIVEQLIAGTNTRAPLVLASVVFSFDASDPDCTVVSGTNVTAAKSQLSGVSLGTLSGTPKLLTDPRNAAPALWLDGASGVTGSDSTAQNGVNGTDKAFTFHAVVTPDDPATNGVILGLGNPANIGNTWQGMVSANLAGLEKRGAPAGPARDWFSAQLQAGTHIIELHSSDGINVYGSVDGGPETLVTQVSPGAITTTNTSLGMVRVNSDLFPFPGYIHIAMLSAADQDATTRSNVRSRLAKVPHPAQIYFLGDSITTAELTTGGGFRSELHNYCVANSLKISQQGPFTAGGVYPLRHSGVSGNHCSQMNSRVNTASTGLGTGTPFRDVKLVHLFAGTNGDVDAPTTAANYSALLSNVFAKASSTVPTVRIAVTTITPISGTTYAEDFNALLPAIWDAFDAAHPSNTLIRWDAHAVFGTYAAAAALGYYVDSTHPNAAGYAALANHPTYGLIQAVAPYLRSISP